MNRGRIEHLDIRSFDRSVSLLILISSPRTYSCAHHRSIPAVLLFGLSDCLILTVCIPACLFVSASLWLSLFVFACLFSSNNLPLLVPTYPASLIS
mmetsp:Transcript_18803/g.47704  ORF Transcript_18803/g.47704 Transcript_18803/m.47704 type:complete len:96 (-) Transcript_18803:61-348(-)